MTTFESFKAKQETGKRQPDASLFIFMNWQLATKRQLDMGGFKQQDANAILEGFVVV